MLWLILFFLVLLVGYFPALILSLYIKTIFIPIIVLLITFIFLFRKKQLSLIIYIFLFHVFCIGSMIFLDLFNKNSVDGINLTDADIVFKYMVPALIFNVLSIAMIILFIIKLVTHKNKNNDIQINNNL